MINIFSIFVLIFSSASFAAIHESNWENDIPNVPYLGEASFPPMYLDEYKVPTMPSPYLWPYIQGTLNCTAKTKSGSHFDFTFENVRPFILKRDGDWEAYYQTYETNGNVIDFSLGGVFNDYPGVSRFYLRGDRPRAGLTPEENFLLNPVVAAGWLNRSGKETLVFEHPLLKRQTGKTTLESAGENFRFLTAEKTASGQFVFRAYKAKEQLVEDISSSAFQYEVNCDHDLHEFVVRELRERLVTKLPKTLKTFTPREFQENYGIGGLSNFYLREGSTYHKFSSTAPHTRFFIDQDGDYFIRTNFNYPIRHKVARDFDRLRSDNNVLRPTTRTYRNFSVTLRSGDKTKVIDEIRRVGHYVFSEPPVGTKTFDLTFSADEVIVEYGQSLLPKMTVKAPKISFKGKTYPYMMCSLIGAHTDDNILYFGAPSSYIVKYKPYTGPVFWLGSKNAVDFIPLYRAQAQFSIMSEGFLENGSVIEQESCYVFNMSLFHSPYVRYTPNDLQ